jgi:Phytanoyl-CoA dioxygenase (PhyH)
MTRLADEPTVRRLEQTGFAYVSLFGPDEIRTLLAVWNHFARFHQGGFASTLLLPNSAARHDIHRVLSHHAAPAVARAMPSYRTIFLGFVNKDPGSRTPMPMHQDITLTEEERQPGISLWAPLIDVDENNACLCVVPGSHLLNRVPRAPGTPFPAAAIEDALMRDLARAVPLQAGQAVLMDQRLFHASGHNQTPRARPVLAAVLIPHDQAAHYVHRIVTGSSVELERFEVADNFLLSHRLGSAPRSGLSKGRMPEAIEPLSFGQIARASQVYC